jgi:hypothetical protein
LGVGVGGWVGGISCYAVGEDGEVMG